MSKPLVSLIFNTRQERAIFSDRLNASKMPFKIITPKFPYRIYLTMRHEDLIKIAVSHQQTT